MKFKLIGKDGSIIEDVNDNVDNWTSEQLFQYLITASVIAPDEDFIDWEGYHKYMVELVKKDYLSQFCLN